jgi:membrane protease YdiL (CAAX protease family)
LSTFIGLAVVLGWFLPVLLHRAGRGLTTHLLTRTLLVDWLIVVILSIIAFSIQGRKLSEFGIRALGWRDALFALGGLVVAFALIAVLRPTMPPQLDFHQLNAIPVGLRIVAFVTAGICEEFVFRGFAIEELTFLTSRRWLAALLPLIVFTLLHAPLYGYSRALLVPGVLGAVLTALYLWRHNLPSCMLMHGASDAISLLILPALVK